MSSNISVVYGDDDIGYLTIDDYILKASVIQETRKIATELPASILDIDLEVREDFIFEIGKPIRLYRSWNEVENETVVNKKELVQKNFITNAKKISTNRWTINATDYIGLMDYYDFKEKFYYKQPISDFLNDLTKICNIPFHVSEQLDSLEEKKINGIVKEGTVREALQEVCFSFGVISVTAKSEFVEIVNVPSEVEKKIDKSRLMSGVVVEKKDPLTSLTIEYSSIVWGGREDFCVLDYGSNEDGSFQEEYIELTKKFGKNIEIHFPNPFILAKKDDRYVSENIINYSDELYKVIYTDSIEQKDPYTIVASFLNPETEFDDFTKFRYARLSFYGRPLSTSTGGIITKKSDFHEYSLQKKEMNISAVGTMTADNAQIALDRIYDNLSIGMLIDANIINGIKKKTYGDFKFGEDLYGAYEHEPPVDVGDNIEIETPNNGIQKGFIQKTTYNLYGSTKIVKKCEIV